MVRKEGVLVLLSIDADAEHTMGQSEGCWLTPSQTLMFRSMFRNLAVDSMPFNESVMLLLSRS